MIIWGNCGLIQTYMDHLKVGLFYHLVPNPLLLLKVQPSALPSVLMFPGSRTFLIINSYPPYSFGEKICSLCWTLVLPLDFLLSVSVAWALKTVDMEINCWVVAGTGEPGGLPSMGSQGRTRLKRLSSSSSVTQSCPTLCDPMDCILPGSSVHAILQARIVEWVSIPFSRGSFWPRDWTRVSCTAGRFFTVWAIWPWDFVCWEIFDYWFNILACYWSAQIFYHLMVQS